MSPVSLSLSQSSQLRIFDIVLGVSEQLPHLVPWNGMHQ